MKRAWLILALIAPGCSSPQPTRVERIDPVPVYQRYVPPLYDADRNVVGPSENGAPYLGLWDSGATNLVGTVLEFYCPKFPLRAESRFWHWARVTYRGTWPLGFVDGDTLRGTLVPESVALVDDGPYDPRPFPDSLGVIQGGTFALAVRADTLEGTAGVQYAGPCSCFTPIQVFLIPAGAP